jgi:hypothetical protein
VIERTALEGAAEAAEDDTPDAEPVVENDETEEDDDA